MKVVFCYEIRKMRLFSNNYYYVKQHNYCANYQSLTIDNTDCEIHNQACFVRLCNKAAGLLEIS